MSYETNWLDYENSLSKIVSALQRYYLLRNDGCVKLVLYPDGSGYVVDRDGRVVDGSRFGRMYTLLTINQLTSRLERENKENGVENC